MSESPSQVLTKIDKPPRFAAKELHSSTTATLQHFTPQVIENFPTTSTGGLGAIGEVTDTTSEKKPEVSRDRFGNRVFTSPDKAYIDQFCDETKAALLISPEGESFIKSHPGILSAIDKALVDPHIVSSGRVEIQFGKEGEQQNGSFSVLERGAQSTVYVLKSGSEKYVIKIKNTNQLDGIHDNISQPYINEMLQTQALATDLKDELAEAHVVMPTLLFASGQMSCTKFESGSSLILTPWRLKALVPKLLPQIDAYIASQNDPLWDNIKHDATNFQRYKWKTTSRWLTFLKPIVDFFDYRGANFKQRKDGTLVWIDPFKLIP